MQHKEEEWKELQQNQVETIKLKDDEIKKLKVRLVALISCITKFQNDVKPYILSPAPSENLTTACHPDSQKSSSRSSWYKESSSSRSSLYLPNDTFPPGLIPDYKSTLLVDKEDGSPTESVTPVNKEDFVSNTTPVSSATNSGASVLADHPLTTSNKASSPRAKHTVITK